MAFLSSGLGSFLGVKKLNDDNDAESNGTQIPAPYPQLRLASTKTTAPQPAQSTDTSASSQDTPEASDPTTPTGPTTATTADTAQPATTTSKKATTTIDTSTKGVKQVAAAPQNTSQVSFQQPGTQAPVTYSQDEQQSTDDSAPTVSADRGDRTTDRDPVTGVVRDRDANNKPAETIAKTYVDENGVVHYASQNPDGTPKEPWADEQGWGQLTEAQQDAALQDYYDRLTAWRDDQEQKANGPGPALGADFDQLDPAGKIERLDAYFAGKTPDTTVEQKIEVAEDGTLHYTQFDADGNLLPPWNDAEGWAALSPEQQQLLREHYADAREQLRNAQPQEGQAGTGYAGLGISEEEFNGYPPEVQDEILRTGNKPPTQNVDGTWTWSNTDGSSVVKDAQGNVVASKTADGVITSFGNDGAQTVASPKGVTVTTDNQGNTRYKYTEGSEAAQLLQLGYDENGEPLSLWEQYARGASSDGQQIDVNNPTPKQQDDFQAYVTKQNQSMWSKGAVYAAAAVQAGLLSEQDFHAMELSPYAESFGAWLMHNRDIAKALQNSNIDVDTSAANLPTPRPAQTNNPNTYSANDDYFLNMRGGSNAMMAADALTHERYDGDYSSLLAPLRKTTQPYSSLDPMSIAQQFGGM